MKIRIVSTDESITKYETIGEIVIALFQIVNPDKKFYQLHFVAIETKDGKEILMPYNIDMRLVRAIEF